VKTAFDSGTEKWLPWAKTKLAQLTFLREKLDLPQLTKTWLPESGTTVRLVSSKFGDWIRITGGWEFISIEQVLEPVLDAEGNPTYDEDEEPIVEVLYKLWGLKRDAAPPSGTGLLIPELNATWNMSTASNPFGGIDSPLPLRDADHKGSVVGGVSTSLYYRRAAGLPAFADMESAFELYDSPEYGSIITSPDLVQQLKTAAGLSYVIDNTGIIARSGVAFTAASGWLPYLDPAYYVTGADSYVGLIRLSNPPDLATYAEKYTWTVNDAGVIVPAVSDTLIAEPYVYTDVVTEDDFSYFGQSEWGQVTYTTAVLPADTVLGKTAGGSVRVMQGPWVFNTLAKGGTLGSGESAGQIPPESVSFMGVEVHDDLTDLGFPYWCSVFPVPVLIEGDQYWWVNSLSIKSSAHFEGVFSGDDMYTYASPHAYTWKRRLIKNGVEVSGFAHQDTRSYTASLDYPQVPIPDVPPYLDDYWDSYTPVYVYVPMDGVRVEGAGDNPDVDWFCGIRVEITPVALGTGVSSDGSSIPFKTTPALWTSDLSTIHVYSAFEEEWLNYDVQTAFNSTQYYFAKYKGAMYFVFDGGVDGTPHGVSISAPTESPVEIVDGTDVFARSYPMVRSWTRI